MKKFLSFCLTAIILMATFTLVGCFFNKENEDNMQNKPTLWDKNRPIKILAIGNSFSDDALWLLPDVLHSLGFENFRVSNLYIGGCSLETHKENLDNNHPAYTFRTNTGNGWVNEENTTLLDGLLSDDWDFITMQQASHYSGLADTYYPIPDIIATVKKYKPNAKLGWHVTWAYPQYTTHNGFAYYDNDQTTMYNSIIDATKNQISTNADFKFIISNGTAIQNARTSFLGDTLNRDGFHLTLDVGRYIASLNYAYTLTGYTPESVTFAPFGVNEKIKAVAKESVINANKKPFEITKSVYSE